MRRRSVRQDRWSLGRRLREGEVSDSMAQANAIGFIGLGVMGEPICRNLLKKSGRPVVAFDLSPEPLARLRGEGAAVAGSIAELMTQSELVFYCLPSGKHVRGLFENKGGILENACAGQVIVDLGTSPVGLTRELAEKLEARGASFADAPIARTREAAINGTLSVMVGASPALFARIEPLIRCFATEVTNCGGVGAGQVTKILNNMVLFQTVNALAEAAAIARRSGVEPKLLFETLAKGSADSFALRNHGLKAVIPGEFPERAFSTEYALKDLSYALDLARDVALSAPGAELAGSVLQEAIDNGFGAAYWPVIAKVVDRR
ncbi:NAD(P)-dependent oxidoreductase [Bradyrhizobium sp. LHD-71]|nr:NAD(P)-dependent oxidoreductase [Bradyrhizobium sp. LHD-71]MDQ8727116.1 NAD(P)-dependent oxidoreductase [Bradyrhizobium sp. LHD-71]